MHNFVIDAGQTGVRLRQLSSGSDLASAQDFEYPGLRTNEPIVGQMAQIIIDHAERLSSQPETVSIAMTGLTGPEATVDQLFELLKPHGVKEVIIAHDSISGFLGALGLNQGAVTASGTGVVTLALGEEKFARVDGWGNIMGDAGSGYWIGSEALDLAMRAHDGRIESTKLLDLMQSHYPNVEEAYIELQQDSNRVARVASLAKEVIALAETDARAKDIVERAAHELVVAIDAGLRRVGFDRAGSPRISWAGKIAGNPLVSILMTAELASLWPNALIIEPLGEPIDGVALLSSISATHPLASQVYRRQ